MRSIIRLVVLGMLVWAGALPVSAQLRPLWHLRLTEPEPDNLPSFLRSGHSLEAMAVDGAGNVYVAGQTLEFPRGAYVAKCSGSGQLLWEKNFDGMQVDSLVVTGSGSFLLSFHNLNFVSLVKFDPDGNILWQADPAMNEGGLTHISSLVQNSQGDFFWLTFLYEPDPSGESDGFPWVLSKFSEDGRRLWRTELPSGHLADEENGFRGSLAAAPDGGAVVAGYRCTRLNADGTVRWTVLPPLKPDEYWSTFSSLALDEADTVMAGGEVISPDGKATLAGWPGQRNRVIGHIPGQGFLISVGQAVWCIDDQGTERWRAWLGNVFASWPDSEQTPAFAFSPSGDGWFAFAQDVASTSGLFVWRFENDGRLRWRKRMSDLNMNRARLAVTPDGGLIAAAGRPDFPWGFLPTEVFSFAIEEDPAAPRVTRSPAATEWDGAAPLTLSVEAVGDSLSYQWRRAGQVCVGETNSTITIRPRLSEFTEPGSYWCEVSNNHGTAASRMANVTLTQPRMIVFQAVSYSPSPLPPDSPTLGFEARMRIEHPFEVSTNLVDWTIGPSVPYWGKGYGGNYTFMMPVSGSGREFYRLKKN